jgi:predicted RNA-binding protein with PUA-like domain
VSPRRSIASVCARGNRLSVIPLTDAEFDAIVAFAKRQRRENRA